MNTNKFFNLCKEKGVEVAELNLNKSSSFSFSIFRQEIDNYKLSTSSKILARGIVNGKLGFCATEKDDKSTPEFLIDNIISSAKYIEKDEEAIIFKGSDKYRKRNLYSKELEAWPTEEKISLLFELEKLCKEYDPHVSEVQVSYGDEINESLLTNSYGLNLKNKRNYYVVSCEVVVKDGEEVKTYYDVLLDTDPKKFVPSEMAKKVVEGALSLLHGVTPKNGTSKVVLNDETVANFLSVILSNLSAEEIQKHTSIYEGKLNTQIISNKLTITEEPLKKNCFYTYFDDEGVATINKKVIEKGVLKTYFYNLETAKKDGVETTANGYRNGSKIGVDSININVKPGRLSEEQLFEKIQNGVYIIGLNGLHSGLDPKSGDFSLQGEGYLVKDGKKDSALSLFIVSGNVFKLFNDVIAVGNNNKLLLNTMNVPSIAFKGLKISA